MKDYDPFLLPVKNPQQKVTLNVDVNPILIDDLVRDILILFVTLFSEAHWTVFGGVFAFYKSGLVLFNSKG